MHKRIILVGKAATGKDFLRKKLESRNFKYAVSYTTRPPREGEINGQDYYFINETEASDMIERGEFYEYINFNGWLYGTTNKQWKQKAGEIVFIMTPSAIFNISEQDRKQCFIVYTDIDKETRKQRLLKRYMPGDSFERRLVADEADFENFTDFDLRITNPDF